MSMGLVHPLPKQTLPRGKGAALCSRSEERMLETVSNGNCTDRSGKSRQLFTAKV